MKTMHKKNKPQNIGIWHCVIAVFLLASCHQQQSDPPQAIKDAPANAIIGNILLIPDSLEVYAPFKNNLMDSAAMATQNLKVFCYIDASCGACIDKIAPWNALVPKMMTRNVPVFLIVESRDKFELFRYICEQYKIKDFPFPFFLDGKGRLLKENPEIKTELQLYAVLTDKNNKILWVGNPLESDSVKSQFFKTLENNAL